MQPLDEQRDDVPGTAHPAVPEGPALFEHIAGTARAITGAARAYVVHRLPEPDLVEVLAATGTDAPAAGDRLVAPRAKSPGRVVIPLGAGSTMVGALVAEDLATPVPPPAQRELALLTATATLAVLNHALLAAAEQRVAESARRHYRLLSGTIYHLKNTLANSSEYLELLELEEELDETQKQYVARSRRSVDVALRLLTELHDLGMTDAGELVPQREQLNIAALIRDIVQDHRLAAGATTVTLTLDMAELPPLHTDADCVRQILDNLIANAVRYSPAEGAVTVRARLLTGRRSDDPAQWLRIDVADMGPGVAELDAVFEEVQRVTRKGAPGFRLAISRRLARLLGGDVVLATAPGEGATFSLWLPAGPDPDQAPFVP
jgi:two-component system, OmpR family, sensor histidine kinase BaeS